MRKLFLPPPDWRVGAVTALVFAIVAPFVCPLFRLPIGPVLFGCGVAGLIHVFSVWLVGGPSHRLFKRLLESWGYTIVEVMPQRTERP